MTVADRRWNHVVFLYDVHQMRVVEQEHFEPTDETWLERFRELKREYAEHPTIRVHNVFGHPDRLATAWPRFFAPAGGIQELWDRVQRLEQKTGYDNDD